MFHTPGPWTVKALKVVDQNEWLYVITKSGGPQGSHWANERLMSAAPDLLECATELADEFAINFLADLEPGNPTHKAISEMLARFAAVKLKLKGKK